MTLPHLWPRHSDRLTFRPPTGPDLDELLEWRMHPDVTRWMLSTTVEPQPYRQAWLADEQDPQDHSAVALLGSRVVGTATMSVGDSLGQGVKRPESPWNASQARIGYLLDPTVHGQGLGTEIVRTLLTLAFEDLGLHRVIAICFADNVPSWRVMEKGGMRREEHSIQDAWHDELGWIDGFTYAMLRSDWEQQREALPRSSERG